MPVYTPADQPESTSGERDDAVNPARKPVRRGRSQVILNGPGGLQRQDEHNNNEGDSSGLDVEPGTDV